MNRSLKIVFAGGGTAGHLYPAINLARVFERKDNCECLFFGTARGIEAAKIPELGYRLELLNVQGFHRRVSWQNFLFLFRLVASLLKSRKILKEFNPHLVIGTGGYVMGPVLKMAIRLGITTVLQEQNSYPGVTTRLLAQKADRVFTAYKETELYLNKGSKISLTGNPVVLMDSQKEKNEIVKMFGLKEGLKTILVFGGSQGAATINNALKNILEVKKLPHYVQILWQCGSSQYESYKKWLEKHPIKNIILKPFIDDMWSAYKIADFCVCRAGAMSLAELEMAKRPSILIPLKGSAGNHQHKNAVAMEKKGFSKLVEDNGFIAHTLYKSICHWLTKPEELEIIQKSMLNYSPEDAGEKIVAEIRKILAEKNVWPE